MISFLQQRIKSFGYAFRGIADLFQSQVHAKIHLLATVIIVLLGWALELNLTEWCLIMLCIGFVITAEAFNTAIEYVVDLASPDFHELAGKAKDVAAGAVLLSVIFCGIVWSLIFLPKIYSWYLGLA